MIDSEWGGSTVTIVLGDDENEGEQFQMPLDFIPRIGDLVEVSSMRDDHGNYLNKHPAQNNYRKILKGVVTRVSHDLWEEGYCPDGGRPTNKYKQYVTVFLSPAKG